MFELAIVIPTFNESANVSLLAHKLDQALEGVQWEAIFVDDDSPDGTADTVRALQQKRNNIRVLQRIGRRGLASACIEGMMATAAPYIAVMDADLQHDERILPQMLRELRDPAVDVAIASRNIGGGSMGEFSKLRVLVSNAGKSLSTMACQIQVSDPMSGFFMVRREFLEGAVRQTSSIGFKILVDLLASSPVPARVKEVPYTFRKRLYGESKLDTNVLLDYLFLIADKTVGHILPVRFVLFSLSGLIGAGVHLVVLWLAHRFLHTGFELAQLWAIVAAMTANFFVNNLVTFRDRRRKGWGLVTGLVLFYVACSIGASLNYALSKFCHNNGMPAWLAALTGLVVGAVWNYGVTNLFTWRSSSASARKNRNVIAQVDRHANPA